MIVPTYKTSSKAQELIISKLKKENQELQSQLDYLRSGEYYNQLRFEINMLEHIVDNVEISKEDKEFIDMTHRNTELLSNWNELKDWLEEYPDEYVFSVGRLVEKMEDLERL